MKIGSLIVPCLLLTSLSGCGSFPPPRVLPPEVSVPEIIEMCRQNVPPPTIIAKIDASQTVFHLTSKEIIELKEQGVPFEIIDFMLQTEKNDIVKREREEWRAYYYRYYSDYYDPFY